MQNRPRWSRTAQQVGVVSSFALLVTGLLYLIVIAAWLVAVGKPMEPIGDPYLAVMEVLTMASALALVGFSVAISALSTPERRIFGLGTVVAGTIAAGLTLSVHFVQLTAIRQLWRSGTLADYRLVWPSPIFAVEYLAWDLLVGITMLLAAASLGEGHGKGGARTLLTVGGGFYIIGLVGPASGVMALQNIAVLGYAVLLPLAAWFTAGVFRRTEP